MLPPTDRSIVGWLSLQVLAAHRHDPQEIAVLFHSTQAMLMVCLAVAQLGGCVDARNLAELRDHLLLKLDPAPLGTGVLEGISGLFLVKDYEEIDALFVLGGGQWCVGKPEVGSDSG